MLTKQDIREMYITKCGECPFWVEWMLDAFPVDEHEGIYNGIHELLHQEIVYLTLDEILTSINAGLEREIRHIRKVQNIWSSSKEDQHFSLDSI